MSEFPLVSIIIPCFNQGQFIHETIESIQKQAYANWEAIIVNDGSSDVETIRILNGLNFEKISVMHTENQGLAQARNNGIKASNGKYILPLDADDKIATSYLEKAVAILEAEPGIRIVYSDAAFFGSQSGHWLLPSYNYQTMLKQNLIFCSALYRRADYDKTKGYNPNMKFGWEDWDFWLSILKNEEGEVHKIPEVLFYYRKHSVSMVGDIAKQQEKRYYLEQQLIKNHPHIYAAQFPEPITLLRELDFLRLEKENFEQVKKQIYSSSSYKLGDFILKPLKSLFKKNVN